MNKSRFLNATAFGIAAFLIGAALRADLPKSGDDFILGPMRQIASVDNCGADEPGAWKSKSGVNVSYSVQSEYALPGVSTSLLRVFVGEKDAKDREPGHNWFVLSRERLPVFRASEPIDGFRFLLGSQTETQWWIQVELTDATGETYSHLLADHPFPSGKILEYAVPLDEFRAKSGAALSPERAKSIRGVSFILSSPNAALLLDRITAYRREKLRSWLDFSTSHPANNLFLRADPVTLRFDEGGTRPNDATGFRYEIRDFFDKVTAKGAIPFNESRRYAVNATPRLPGYYEVRAFYVDASGRDVGKSSRIRAEGSVPEGLGTFSVLPSTLKENAARSRKLGTSAFFGLHGDFLNLADDMGLTWRFEYTGWAYLEPEKPDRSGGMAPWALERMRQPPAPDGRFHILPFRGNMAAEVPGWAKSGSSTPPVFKNWDDYLAMVRDSVKVEKHRYPRQTHRIYGGAWEINLNMPPYDSQSPEFQPKEIVELFRRFRETVKAEDPGALVIGPCPSVINIEWFEPLFKAGLLKYLDGIETHGYNEGLFTPEENNFPRKIARLNALTKKYKGRTLPIYCTEAGQPGVLGADVVYRSQAQRMARAAIILKGEGVKVFLPFYGIDYDRSGYWGFCFNEEIDSPSGPWETKRISPKPMVNAIAECVKLLEGAAPKGRIRLPGRDAWGYAFEKEGARIAAVWTVGAPHAVSLPAGKARSAEIVDLMGRMTPVKASRGVVRVSLDESPKYVLLRD